MNLLLSSIHTMHSILLVCEVFIAVFGIFAVIVADNTHERLHGLFVVGLALEGFLSIEYPDSVLTFIVMIILTVLAFLMIIMGFHSLIEHLRKYLHRIKNPEVVPPKPSLNVSEKSADVNKLASAMLERFDRLEKMLSEKEASLNEREAAVLEREKQLEEGSKNK